MEDTSDLGNNDSNENYLGDANVTGSPDSSHFGDSSCVNGSTDSPMFYPDFDDDDDDSVDSCVNTQEYTRTSTSNSFVNDDIFESNTTNTSNESFVNDDMGTTNDNIHEATFGDTEILEDFRKYSDASYQNRCSLTAEDCAGIELLEVLAKARAPLNLYDFIYKWHVNNLDAAKVVTQKSLLVNMKKRYHLNNSSPKLSRSITLPHSRACVDLVVHDFKWQVQSLLTDPRICQSDYLFHDNDPFAPPPEHFSHISDVNTGLAYRETYKRLIKDPRRDVLLPIIFYMDGAVTGQYDKLPIEALKFTLGIFKGIARNRKSAWRELGYVTKFLAEETKGIDQIRKSGHMDVKNYFVTESVLPNEQCVMINDEGDEENGAGDNDEEDEEDDDDVNQDLEEEVVLDSCSAQDLHAMLDVFLASYREIEEVGFEWDLRYNDSTHRVHFIPFVLFIKGDTVEHDKHCGSYTSRTKHVQQLCRYCCCPSIDTDDPYRRDDRKNQKMIQDLVDSRDEDGLKAISQQYVQNTWYKVRFGLHNNLGVHGACTLEMLHWLQLGKYKYIRKMFFAQTGNSSSLSTKINTLAKMFGLFYKRNSDRDLPRTDFAKGIMKGKLMANEYTGLILILCTVLRCFAGRRLLLEESRGNQKKLLGQIHQIRNWIMLLETMLQWEAWLKQPSISVFEIHRFEVKVRELMALEKTIGQRNTGMKFRTFNFHASLHVADDILYFGVPNHVNTSTDESQHKPDKTAAKRTQRRPKTFDKQCADRIHDMRVVEHGLQEIRDGGQKWCYYQKTEEMESQYQRNKERSNTAQQHDIESGDEDDDVSSESSLLGDGNHDDDDIEEDLYSMYSDTDMSTILPVATESDIKNSGVRCRFFYCNTQGKWVYTVKSRMKNRDNFQLGHDLETFLADLSDVVVAGTEESSISIDLFTEHKRFDQIYRGSPHYRGLPWRDWAMINWGNGVILPGQIWIFVNLQNIPEESFHDPGIYAIIESSDPNPDVEERRLSQILQPFLKETKTNSEGRPNQRRFHLVPVSSIHSPICMIPDHGNPDPSAYLKLAPKSEWAKMFSNWLEKEHSREFPSEKTTEPGH